MKTQTERIASALRILARDIKTDDGVVNTCLEEAAGRLEELQRELTEAVRERNKTVANLIDQRDAAIASARQEPSRLEIAAQLLCVYVNEKILESQECIDEALLQADTLIRAERELKL